MPFRCADRLAFLSAGSRPRPSPDLAPSPPLPRKRERGGEGETASEEEKTSAHKPRPPSQNLNTEDAASREARFLSRVAFNRSISA